MVLTKIVLIALVVLALFYLGALLFLFLRQKHFIFFPTPLPRDYSFAEFDNFEEVVLNQKGKRYWHAVYFSHPKPKGCVLYLHGNTGHIAKWGVHADTFRRLGYAVMMIDYPSYGKSKGLLTERAINKESRLAYDWLLNKFSTEEIVILGRSLGTGPAARLATKVASKCLILETPFSSIPAMAEQHYKIFPVKKLLQFRFNTLRRIKQTLSPVYIIHGTQDELIPYEMAEKIAAKKGTLITIPNRGHNDFIEEPLYQSTLENILQ